MRDATSRPPINLRHLIARNLNRDMELISVWVADQKLMRRSHRRNRCVDLAEPNNAEAVLRDVLDWRDRLRQTVGNNLSSVYCHRLIIKSATLFVADPCQQLDDREVGVKKGLKVY